MMVASVIVTPDVALAVDGAAEFPGKNHQGVFEQVTGLQVFEQRRGRLVDIPALSSHIGGEGGMMIPAAVEELDEADISFSHSAGEQAIAGVGAWFVDLGAVHLEDLLRLL